jgi:hypothetical protein
MKLHQSKSKTHIKLQIEMVKAFFHESVNDTSFYCDTLPTIDINILASVYLSTLYYRTKQYRTATEYCLLAQKWSKPYRSLPVIDGQFIADVNDDISCVSGLIVVYSFIQRVAVNQRPTLGMNIFNVELFSLYLITCCSCRTKVDRSAMSKILASSRQCFINNWPSELCIGDFLLSYFDALVGKRLHKIKLYSRRSQCKSTLTASKGQSAAMNTIRVRCLLMQSAVEHLTKARHVAALDYGPLANIIGSDYEAMYAYKCGEHERCNYLCQQNVFQLQNVTEQFPVFYVLSSDLVLLADDDCLSLIGLTVFENVAKLYPDTACVCQLTLSLYLLVQCQLQLKHSLLSLHETLRRVIRYIRLYPSDLICDRLMLIFVYRKARRSLHCRLLH